MVYGHDQYCRTCGNELEKCECSPELPEYIWAVHVQMPFPDPTDPEWQNARNTFKYACQAPGFIGGMNNNFIGGHSFYFRTAFQAETLVNWIYDNFKWPVAPPQLVQTPEILRILKSQKPPQTFLDNLIEEARKKRMTEQEKHEQRVSFAYGNAAIDDPTITKEDIEAAARRLNDE